MGGVRSTPADADVSGGTIIGVPGNLPVALTPVVGRAREIEEMEGLLGSARLLTLTGPGGSGKTRLALALAQRATERFPAGAWWVELASVEDDSRVAQQAVSELEAGQLSGRGPVDALVARLGPEPALLVLDNCEQVVDGCAELLSELLAACPQLTVIATSRRLLGVADEQRFRLTGLATDSDAEGAIDLFLARARRHLPGLVENAATTAAIEAICRQLDGMPLAIELAAARTPMMTVADMARLLETDSRLLVRGTSSGPVRQQSLRAALGWSYRLLTDGQRALLRRLGVFRGTFDLEGAEAVASGGAIDVSEVLDALAGLVDQSLVEPIREGSTTRYRLLLVVRRYAEEQLVHSGESEEIRARHLRHFLDFAARAATELRGSEQTAWLSRLESEHDNLRAALATAHRTDAETAARLAAHLWQFWNRRGYFHEGQRWLEDVIAISDAVPSCVRAEVVSGASVLAMLRCDYPLATRRSKQALALYREFGDRRGIAKSLQRIAGILREQARYAESVRLYEQSLEIWRALSDDVGIADTYYYLAFVLWLAGEFERAERLCVQALELFSSRGRVHDVLGPQISLATIAHYQGEEARAADLLDEVIALTRQFDYREGTAWALHCRALVYAAGHELARAAESLVDSLELHWDLGDLWRTTRVVEDIAGILLARSEPALAARLLSCAECVRERLGTPVPAAERPAYDRCLASLRRTLAATELQSAWREGSEMELEAAVRDARGAARRLYVSGRITVAIEEVLTPREAEVMRLVDQGRTNREIGAALFISPATAGVHVSSILRKLGVRSRAEAVARAHQLGLL